MMKRPPFLAKGDKIGIVATARKISAEEISFAVKKFEEWGLTVVYGKNLFNVKNQFSGTDEERVSDLQEMLDDDSVRAVISARGGYGTIRIIDRLDFSKFLNSPKWIIGYSDITVLHLHIHQNFAVETIHATMPISFGADEESVETLRRALFGELNKYTFPGSNGLARKGTCEGQLSGGNLSLIYALNNSKSDLDTKGKILFLEDLDEYLYHLDRMMVNLKRGGKLSGLAGLVVGGLTEMKDNPVPFGKTPEEIIMDSVKEYSYPVCFDFPAGHGKKNFSFFSGRRCRLEVEEKISLEFLS